ncbi:exodeoxyribonuclease III [Ameyamaea chiangmaiensis NBRC 103196]|nr:exodeoxyribonuclease III [Ameyamaea chiangmaiensis NBRC 103196]
MTWNINSLRLRLPLLSRLTDEIAPDIVCLQETKVSDDLFPSAAVQALGYRHVHFRGMKSYNGVAILSRLPMRANDRAPDWCGKGDCRHVAVTLDSAIGPLDLHNFYVPAGGDIPDPEANPKYAHKLAFVDEATGWFTGHTQTPAILVGDLNIAPLEQDVWSHKQLLDVVSHTPPETSRMNAWLQTGFVDAMRHFVPSNEKLYTWWSYRNRDWKASNRGRRLDHVWVTQPVVPQLRKMTVLNEVRDWPSPSDHVPVVMDIDL